MIDLSTTYLGLKLKNPLIASSSPLSKKLDTAKRLEDAGVSAVVMYSLFEEEIIHESLSLDYYLSRGTESYAEAITYFPNLEKYNVGPEGYLEHIQELKKSLDIPVIASLNGISSGGWINYAKKIQQAGADALELNIYYVPTELDLSAQQLEESYAELVSDTHKEISIPLSVKLSPQFTVIPNMVQKLSKAGARGLVLFNRFMQPNLDIENLEIVPDLQLSTSDELLLPLRWTAILYGRVAADLAITGGVHNGQDVVKSVMAGASAVMVASEFLKNGIGRASQILSELDTWMTSHEYPTVEKMRGSLSQKNVAEPAAFERANYMKALQSFDEHTI